MSEKKSNKPILVIVTGLSGSGLTTMLNTLQDNGFFCIDNLPIELISSTLDLILDGSVKAKGFAFGMDIRDKGFAQEFPAVKESIQRRVNLDVVYLTAESPTIAIRYGSTRRAHPLIGKKGDLTAAIERERVLLAPVSRAADLVLDTTTLSPHALARKVEERYSKEIPARSLYVTITSFGFKHGQHRHCDSIFDVRFLSNPYFVPDLKNKTGLDKPVMDFIRADQKSREFMERLEKWHRFLLPLYLAEGKHYFRIGIGCTGGKHRSVFVAEWLANKLKQDPIPRIVVNIAHRDIHQEDPALILED